MRSPLKHYRAQAEARLSKFKQASLLAVGLTSLLVLFSNENVEAEQAAETSESLSQAAESIRGLLEGFYRLWPKLVIAAILLLLGYLLAQAIKWALRKFFEPTPKRMSFTAIGQILAFFLFAITALSVITGDAKALLGSIGLLGLALSWALQVPIESFTGWILNTFRAYYRVGDRINVGEMYGDVYRIDILNTTVWELGGPGKSVSGAQPTGALISFPNNQILRSNVTNYSRDFPFIWDEVGIGISNESDLSYSVEIVREIVSSLVGKEMKASTQSYEDLLRRQGLNYNVASEPEIYLSPAESYIELRVRYLVELRKRRWWSSMIFEKITTELQKPEHQSKIQAGYPRVQSQRLDA